MKNTLKMLLASAALAVPSMASANELCTFASDKNLPADTIATYIAQYKPTTVGEFVTVLGTKIITPAQQQEVFVKVPEQCRKNLSEGLLELNKLKFSDPISVLTGRNLYLPTIATIVAPVQKPVAEAPATATVNVPAKPSAEPGAELRKTQADLQSAKQEQSRLKAEVAAIAARSTNTQLSPEDRAKVDQLLNVNKVVKDLEAVVKRLSAVEADVLTLQNDMGKKAGRSELNALGNRVAALENAPPVTEAGWTWYDWAVLGLSVLGALAFLLAVYVVFFRKVDVRTAVNNALQTAGLSQTVFRAELDELKGEVEKLSTDVADSAKDHKQVELPANLEEQLKALGDGESTEIVGTISGTRGLIGFTKSGDNFVTTTDIDKQTQPMNIEKISKHSCGIRSTLLRHIGAGRVKLRPIAQAVNS